MTSIELTSITGIVPPYIIYACDVYGMFCVPIATVSVTIPPPNTIVLPPMFASAPAVGIKVVSSTCERFEVFFCTDLFPENVCLDSRTSSGPSTFTDLYFNFTIDENINGRPSWIGDISGTTNTLYWTGSQWEIQPFNISNPGPDLNFGLWYDPPGPGVEYYLFNSYCPSICMVIFDGFITTNYFLQYASYTTFSILTPYYFYDDGITIIYVYWDSMSNLWTYQRLYLVLL